MSFKFIDTIQNRYFNHFIWEKQSSQNVGWFLDPEEAINDVNHTQAAYSIPLKGRRVGKLRWNTKTYIATISPNPKALVV